MLKKITLHNFKSFRDCTFELAPLTLMVGANASGKSNFVDALRILQGYARGLTLSDILSGKWEGGQRVWLPIRGGEQEIFHLSSQTRTFEIEIQWKLANTEGAYPGTFFLAVELVEEGLFDVLKDNVVMDDVDASLNGLSFNLDLSEDRRHQVVVFEEWLKDFHFLDLAPTLMRDYVPKNRLDIGMRGENLSAMLFKLTANPDQRRTVLDWVQELCPQEIVDFDFIETKLGDVLLAIKEPNGVTISARSMSDGTLRFLAIIVALLTAKEGTTFIIEEIDSDLHPSRLHLLVSFLEQVTTSRKLQVIASTHSSYLLDYLSEESLKEVLVFYREEQSVETKVTKLVDIPGYGEARKNMPLDLMHASNWMEQNL